jgi:hypothetical protein
MRNVRIGTFIPATFPGGTSTIYSQSDLTGLFCPSVQFVCSSNLAARHINAKDPAVVTTIANLTANLSVELVHYNSEFRIHHALQKYFTMVRAICSLHSSHALHRVCRDACR